MDLCRLQFSQLGSVVWVRIRRKDILKNFTVVFSTVWLKGAIELPRTEFGSFPGSCPVVTGQPGTGDNPIRNTGLTAGSGEVVSLSVGQSEPWTETTNFHNQG